MNPVRILIAVVVAFISIGATDYLIHEVWLHGTYAQDVGRLWRSPEEMKSHFSGLLIGQFVVALAFTMIWVRVALGGAGIQCALGIGFFLGLYYSGGVLITNAVQPLPVGLATKWIFAGILQSMAVGTILFFVYKPTKSCPDIRAK